MDKKAESVKRTAEPSAVYQLVLQFMIQPSVPRTEAAGASNPSDESLGYYHPSAAADLW
jgi:hypothetical protein